jgi:hypothetical protein
MHYFKGKPSSFPETKLWAAKVARSLAEKLVRNHVKTFLKQVLGWQGERRKSRVRLKK